MRMEWLLSVILVVISHTSSSDILEYVFTLIVNVITVIDRSQILFHNIIVTVAFSNFLVKILNLNIIVRQSIPYLQNACFV